MRKQSIQVFEDDACGLLKDTPWHAQLITQTDHSIETSSRYFKTQLEAFKYTIHLKKQLEIKKGITT